MVPVTDDERTSVWSVPSRLLPRHYLAFAAAVIASAVLSVWGVFFLRPDQGFIIVPRILEAGKYFASMVVAAAATIITIMGVSMATGILATALRNELTSGAKRGWHDFKPKRELKNTSASENGAKIRSERGTKYLSCLPRQPPTLQVLVDACLNILPDTV